MKKKGCLWIIITSFVTTIVILLLIGIIVNVFVKDIDVGIAQYIDVDKEDARNIDTILEECGVINIQSVTPDELLNNAHFEGEQGFRINTSDINNVILYLNQQNEVYLINYAGMPLYENGNPVDNLRNYYLTVNETSILVTKIQDLVKSILLSPSTAKFQSILEWKISKNKEIITVESYVDSQNGFGAVVRSYFKIIVNEIDLTVNSFIFDGKELVNQ